MHPFRLHRSIRQVGGVPTLRGRTSTPGRVGPHWRKAWSGLPRFSSGPTGPHRRKAWSDDVTGDDALGDAMSAPHEDLPADRGAARAAFRTAARFASVAAIGGLLFGYDISVTNGAVKALQAHF